jgi:hypothetical protein
MFRSFSASGPTSRSRPSTSFLDQPVGNFFNLGHIFGCCSAHVIPDQFFTAFPDLIVSRRILAPSGE